jgi:ribosome-associated protein
MLEKKAHDVVLMDLREVPNAVAQFFVLCSGTSDTQLDAITNSIDKEVTKEFSENPWHVEGRNNKSWKLIDYIDVVAHVFKSETREFYNLEGLWGDAKIEEIETIE